MSKDSYKGSANDILSFIDNHNMSPDEGMSGIPTPDEFAKAQKQHIKYVEDFPIHLYPPRAAQTFDVRRSVSLTNPTVLATLIDFTIPERIVGFWRSYALFVNTQVGTTAIFDIRINGNVAFKYHGDSLAGFVKNLALGQDLTSEIDALQELQAGDRITISGTLSAPPPVGVPASIAARIKGWLITDRIELKGRAS